MSKEQQNRVNGDSPLDQQIETGVIRRSVDKLE